MIALSSVKCRYFCIRLMFCFKEKNLTHLRLLFEPSDNNLSACSPSCTFLLHRAFRNQLEYSGVSHKPAERQLLVYLSTHISRQLNKVNYYYVFLEHCLDFVKRKFSEPVDENNNIPFSVLGIFWNCCKFCV